MNMNIFFIVVFINIFFLKYMDRKNMLKERIR